MVWECGAYDCGFRKMTPLGLDKGLVCFDHVSDFSKHLSVQASDIKLTHSPKDPLL